MYSSRHSSVVTTLVILLLSSLATLSRGEEASTLFNVKPSGQLQRELVKLKQEACVFSYTAFGGTQEQWRMSLNEDNDVYTCTIERPEGTSYLMFQNFAATIAKHQLSSVEAFSNSGALLRDEDFVLEGDTVKGGEGFQSNLVALHLRAEEKTT